MVETWFMIYLSERTSKCKAYHLVLKNTKLLNTQVYFKSSLGVATSLKVKSQETLEALTKQFHDKRGTEPRNVKWVVLNFFRDHFDGVFKKYLLKDTSADSDVIIHNELKKNELNRNDMKWELSATLETRLEEVHHSKLKREIVRWIRKNTNTINVKPNCRDEKRNWVWRSTIPAGTF